MTKVKGERRGGEIEWHFPIHFQLIPPFIYYNSWYLKVPWMVCSHMHWLEYTLPSLFFILFRSKCYAHQTLISKKNLTELKSIRTIKHNYMPYYKTDNQAGHFSLILWNIQSMLKCPQITWHSSLQKVKFISIYVHVSWTQWLAFRSQYFRSDATWLSGLGHKSEALWLTRLIPPEKIQCHKSSPGT